MAPAVGKAGPGLATRAARAALPAFGGGERVRTRAALAALAAARSERALKGLVKGVTAVGLVPAAIPAAFEELYATYKGAVLGSGVPGADDREVAGVLRAIAGRTLKEFLEPYEFPSEHKRILAPYNYYEFGQRYVRNLVNFERSWLGHRERWDDVQARLARGENVILLTNHQSEADPGVFALLLEQTHPELAEEVAYVAGDRVTDDALCKPFTMGRNVFCVHSKKHMDDDPATRPRKQKQNMKTLGRISKALGRGGQLLWIAPSGGRDRPDPATGVFSPAEFDPAAVDLMAKLAGKAKKTTTLFPMAMWSAPVMPPPAGLEKDLGEQRVTNFSGVSISLGAPVDPAGVPEGQSLSDTIFEAVCEEYAWTDRVIRLDESPPAHFSQPFLAGQKERQAQYL